MLSASEARPQGRVPGVPEVTMPKRIQRSRAKGSRLPEGAVCVSRGTRWGNPYRVEQSGGDWYVTRGEGHTLSLGPHPSRADAHTVAVRMYARWLRDAPEAAHLIAAARSELRGKSLACWCPMGLACHADELLEVANGPKAIASFGEQAAQEA